MMTSTERIYSRALRRINNGSLTQSRAELFILVCEMPG